ncbi:MAG: DUF5666 domain-containing protein [Chloroflexi bacterium]|nr:DUF5666 domain-containing protein [Chloroflexota bacterium]
MKMKDWLIASVIAGTLALPAAGGALAASLPPTVVERVHAVVAPAVGGIQQEQNADDTQGPRGPRGRGPQGTAGAQTDGNAQGDTQQTDDRRGPGGPGGPGGEGGPRGPQGPRGQERPDMQVTLTAVAGQTITLQNGRGWTKQVVTDGATVIRRAAQTIALTDLHTGDKLRVRDLKQTDGSYLAKEITVALPGAGGKVTAVAADSLTLTGRDNAARTVTLNAATTYRKYGKAAAATDLVAGDQVRIEGTLDANNVLTALVVDIEAAKADGEITKIDGTTLTLKDRDAGRTVVVTAATSYLLAGQAATSDSLAVGRRIHAEGTVDANKVLTAVVVRMELPRVHGKVTAVDGTTITLEDRSQTKKVVITATTRIDKGPDTAGAAGDITVGSQIDVEGTADAGGVVTAVVIHLHPAPPAR